MMNRRAPVVAIFDLDGTITSGDMFLAFLSYVLCRRLHRLWHMLTLPPLVLRFALGCAGNDEVKHRFLYAVVGGLHRAEVARFADRFVSTRGERMVKEAALKRIAAHAAAGDILVLATASLDLYAKALGERLGFRHVLATRARWQGDRFAPGLEGANLRGEAKRDAVVALLVKLALDRAETVVYTDHHSDLPLLRCAARGIAVDPTSRLCTAVAGTGIRIERWNS